MSASAEVVATNAMLGEMHDIGIDIDYQFIKNGHCYCTETDGLLKVEKGVSVRLLRTTDDSIQVKITSELTLMIAYDAFFTLFGCTQNKLFSDVEKTYLEHFDPTHNEPKDASRIRVDSDIKSYDNAGVWG